MDKQRAEQIIAAPNKIEVKYLGKPVWIESIKSDFANVTVEGTCKTMDVPITDLKESSQF